MTTNETKTWLITGAGRGMGVNFAQAALAAGHNVVATGRNPETVQAAVGEHENLLVTDQPPTRWAAGEDVVAGVEQKARLLLEQVDAHRELSTSLAHDDARAAA